MFTVGATGAKSICACPSDAERIRRATSEGAVDMLAPSDKPTATHAAKNPDWNTSALTTIAATKPPRSAIAGPRKNHVHVSTLTVACNTVARDEDETREQQQPHIETTVDRCGMNVEYRPSRGARPIHVDLHGPRCELSHEQPDQHCDEPARGEKHADEFEPDE